MIQWIETENGKQPFTLAQVIKKRSDKYDDEEIVLFKIYPYKQLFLMDLEPLSYEDENYDNLVEKDSIVWLNAQSWASKEFSISKNKSKQIKFNENNGIIFFKGEVIFSDNKEQVWVDADIPIEFMNVDQNKNIPSVGDYIEKNTTGLRVAKIIPIKNIPVKVDDQDIKNLKSL